MKSAKISEHPSQCDQNDQSHNIDEGEPGQITTGFGLRCVRIEAERNQAGQRSDGRTQTTDVDTEQQRLPVFGEAAQQDGSRDVTDDLAGSQGCQQGRAADNVLQAGAHAVQLADVARE